jgi:hypothetical protein
MFRNLFWPQNAYTGVLISLSPDLLPDAFCLMVRIFRLMLVLLYIYINSTTIPQIIIINRIYETQNLPGRAKDLTAPLYMTSVRFSFPDAERDLKCFITEEYLLRGTS